MKRLKRFLLWSGLFTSFPAAIFANGIGLAGEWENASSNSGDITRFIIMPSLSAPDQMEIRVFGRCHSGDCERGTVELHLYGTNGTGNDRRFGKAVLEQDFKEITIIMELKDDHRLMVGYFSRFHEDSLENHHSYDIFRKVSDGSGLCEGPDLVVDEIKRPIHEGGKSIVYVNIKNIGTSSAGESHAKLSDPSTFESNGTPFHDVVRIPALSAGEIHEVLFTLPYWVYNPDAELEVTVDHAGNIGECAENNNTNRFFEPG